MSGNRKAGGSSKSARNSTYKIAPMTRAVRSALAASTLALALGASGAAIASDTAPTRQQMILASQSTLDLAPVVDLTVVQAEQAPFAELAINVTDAGDVVIDNADPISEYGLYDTSAISGYSTGGNVEITNQPGADLYAGSVIGNAIGIYAYSTSGSVEIDNAADISTYSYLGLADGIFASGADVDVDNSGTIDTYGYTWSAGIEAQGADSVTVTNSGDITADAGSLLVVYDYYYNLVGYSGGGQAFGIYATGGEAGANVENSGNITVDGGYATGIEAQSYGDTSVSNSGDIVAGSGLNTYYNSYNGYLYYYGSQVATGINASSNGEGAHVGVTNSGAITVGAAFGATGIAATATGLGGSASIDNSGDIYASQDLSSGYGAYGLIASADGNADVNNDGDIVVRSGGAASGATALSFAGDASVTNSGDIDVASDNINYATYGIVAFAGYGDAIVDNSGSINVANSKYQATAIDARAYGDVAVSNSGSLYADGMKYAFGVYATAASGDVSISNDATGEIGFYSYLGRGWGAFGFASQGDVNLTNDGVIDGYAYGQSAGLFGRAVQGDVSADNTGVISVSSGGDVAVGVFARADYGTASVTNSGDITASDFPGGYYTGYAAYGVIARGAYAEVANSGNILADGFYYATGIAASSLYGTTVVNTGGTITAQALGGATGIDASSVYGDVTVANASTVDAYGAVFGATAIRGYSVLGNVDIDNQGDIEVYSALGDAIGIYGYSYLGDVSIQNSGNIDVYSYEGLADGIFASGANVDVANSGAIESYGYTWSAGIEAQGADSVAVTNSGDITATTGLLVAVYDYYYNTVGYSSGGQAFGIYATGGEAGASVANTGDITVQGGYVTGIEVQSYGDVAVSNAGDIVAGSGLDSYYNAYNGYLYYFGTQVATGINASSNGEGAHVGVTNSGAITVDAAFGASGIAATAAGYNGSASVTNTGDIYAAQAQKYGYGAYGVVVSADGDATIGNGGAIEVHSGGSGVGLAALSFAGDANVMNAGDIEVETTATGYYGATGILAFAGNGSAYVNNSGSVSAIWDGLLGSSSRAIDAQGQQGVTVVNSGSLYSNSKYAYGVYALSSGGDVMVGNTADGEIGFYSYSGDGFGVLGISYLGDVDVGNAGVIDGYAYGQSSGIFGVALEGDTTISNSGSITTSSGGGAALGIFARADAGTATIVNTGDITASDFPGGYFNGVQAYGVMARGAYADVGNGGSITAEGNYYATGIVARSTYGTTVVTTTDSSVDASALLVAIGIEARSDYGDAVVQNGGDITVEGVYGGGVGVQAYSLLGNVSVANGGQVDAMSTYGIAIGLSGLSVLGNTSVTNSGMVHGDGYYGAYGIAAQSEYGEVSVTNAGEVSAHSAVEAVGIFASAYGDVDILNSGDVTASADAGGMAAAVEMVSAYGHSTLTNTATGDISVATGAYAVVGSDALDTIVNRGLISGSIALGGNVDLVNNLGGGVIELSDATLDMGGGDDMILNDAGAQIVLENGMITMGDGGSSEVFVNSGFVTTRGYGLIDMGGGAFTNNNVLDFLDGATDDVLVIEGDLAGSGMINLDLSLLNQASDLLYVDGNVVSNAVQTVNVDFPGMPTTAHTSVEFAFVSGTSVAGNFVGGQIIGWSPANFLDVGVTVTSDIDASNATDDVFMVNVDVNGLNDVGSLAASASSGAANFLNSQVGTFRQRLGVNPYGDPGKVMSAFLRFYTDEGDVNPQHHAANFGQGGNFDYDQASWGREIGVNANVFGNVHVGLVLGSADSRQRLTGAGVGENRMDGMTWGAYATWYQPEGFYVDLTGRWMAVDIRSTSIAGLMESRAHTRAYSLEAGYEFAIGGFKLVPQAQYVRTRVDDIDAFYGNRANFESHGGTFSRGRLGLEFNSTFQAGSMRITPYASINAVREFDGETYYTVADNFFGSTSTEGTSTLAELGFGLQKGGFGFTLGANWTDGGAFDSFVGGQASIRFAW